MLGLISCVKNRPNGESRYCVVSSDDGLQAGELESKVVLRHGEVAEILLGSNGSIESAAIVDKGEAERHTKEILSRVAAASRSTLKKNHYRKGIEKLDSLTARMWPKLCECSALFVRKLILGAPIVVRFHNDADGSSGACSLYRGIGKLTKELGLGHGGNISWVMHPGVSYSSADASYDTLIANGYSSMEKPLLLIIDFGTSLDSNAGIRDLDDRFDIIWLDHHPLADGFVGKELANYVNPWLFGGDSNYTAGFLASAFSRTFSEPENGSYEDASFIGDYSEYADPGRKGQEIATILDLLTSDTRIGSGSFSNKLAPYEIENILKDKGKVDELLSYANTRLNEILDLGLTSLRKHKADDVEIHVLDYGRVRSDETKYPLPGRYASKLLERISEIYGGKNIVIVHVGAYISIRIEKELGERVRILEIINELKSEYGNLIDAGGGHRCAASIKLYDKSSKGTVLKELVSMIKESLK